jgi:predicted dehydrogenase
MTVGPGPEHVSIGIEGELRTIDRPVRLAMLGCGSHTFRNVLPVLRFLPAARLVACCDLNLEKARAYARSFGAQAAFTDYRAMIDRVELDAVLVVLGFAADGRPRYPELVSELLALGLPVWLEKPPAATEQEVVDMQAAAVPPAFAQVGFKKMFAPSTTHVRALLARTEFDHVSSYTYRYSVDLPERPGDLTTPDGRRFLDDFVHVASMLVDLIDLPSAVTSYRDPSGDGMVILEHASGTVGSVHLSANASGLDAIEEVLVVGRGANVRIRNGVEVEFYPTGWRGPYGRSVSYFPQQLDGVQPDVTEGVRRWFPEFSLGTISNGREILQGYYKQLNHFVSCVANGTVPERADLDDARRVMALVETVRLPYGVRHEVRSTVGPRSSGRSAPPPDGNSKPTTPTCRRTGLPLVMKDGWNHVCETCGATTSAHEQPIRPCPLDLGNPPVDSSLEFRHAS